MPRQQFPRGPAPLNQGFQPRNLNAGNANNNIRAPRPVWHRAAEPPVLGLAARVSDMLRPTPSIRPPILPYRAAVRAVPVPKTIARENIEKAQEVIPVPIGRGSIRGRRIIDTQELFKAARPESSLGATGKQGNTGKKISLVSNYFPITAYAQWSLYQYRVDFNPEEDLIGTKKRLLGQHRERLGGYIFDGTMLFTGTRFDPENFELISKYSTDEEKMVVISVKYTSIIESGDYAYIQVFNLLLRNCMRHLDLKMIGRNFYDPVAKIDLPNHKLQLWPGYEASIGMYEKDILLCAEISTKVMRQETVLDFLNTCANDRQRNKDWMITFQAGVVGTTVMTLYNNETYRIDDIDETVNPYSEFSKKDGTKMTYIDYYKTKWGITIHGDTQPLLVSKNKKSIRRFGLEETLIYLVPELCLMTGLTDAMRNNFNLMKDMAIHTRISPSERMSRLTNFANRLLSKDESVAELQKWNLTLKNGLIDVPGRVLAPESIKLSNRTFDGGPEANWTKHLRCASMFTCPIIQHWVILSPNDYVSGLQTFIHSLQKASKGMSFMLPNPIIVPMQDSRSISYLKQLEITINERNPSMILCIIPSPRGDLYSLIKRKLCIDRAVPSQVVLGKNIQKPNLSVCTKIAIQVNCKIGGAPWLINIPKKGMMIVGYDVCHDSQRKNISYGALVATMGDTHTSYFSCVEHHESGEDLSGHFAAGISKALMKYRNKNGQLPTSVVVYRDGVGDGQISHVQNIEVKLMKNAFETFYGPGSVPFAFVLVTKRISTRFISHSKQGLFPPQNPPPGTIVDSVVTDPKKYDFFLVSQHVTVTPTHYNVIEDTLKLPPDIMQRLTYKLTHMYYNWSGTVRVPAPCQLAHKLAFLTSTALKSSPNSALDELLYFL
ncbi:Piwi domain,Ribonuclease H-like domain,PAZ domain [Cinara cedri]|uniref:Piwi domain,Ribonuclease H-like domain,PAZ domain n=1 Tax=Cinara cedri TaxID=506608 RepID=A0A5E4MA08_9HEMI|nr:Piwi domain,Ribonuclease H-like domain,PAZ domain [Cinara cedri]